VKESVGGNKDAPASGPGQGREQDAKLTVELFEEQLSVGKETAETGSVRVSKKTISRQADIDADLLHEDAIIETVPRGQRIFVMPTTRIEGDTTIVPIVEEVLYTERRLVLKEELRITRRRSTQHFHETVTLRRQEAVVSRIQRQTEEHPAGPGEHLEKPKE
jgi:uncharacterized protein (TIGR02271 family)